MSCFILQNTIKARYMMALQYGKISEQEDMQCLLFFISFLVKFLKCTEFIQMWICGVLQCG